MLILLSPRASTELLIEHVGSVGTGTLSDTDFIASSLLRGSEWRLKSLGQIISAELPDVQTDGQTNSAILV